MANIALQVRAQSWIAHAADSVRRQVGGVRVSDWFKITSSWIYVIGPIRQLRESEKGNTRLVEFGCYIVGAQAMQVSTLQRIYGTSLYATVGAQAMQ